MTTSLPAVQPCHLLTTWQPKKEKHMRGGPENPEILNQANISWTASPQLPGTYRLLLKEAVVQDDADVPAFLMKGVTGIKNNSRSQHVTPCLSQFSKICTSLHYHSTLV